MSSRAEAAITSNLRKRWKTGLVVLFVVGLLAWNAYQASKLLPGSKAPPQRANAVICTNCDWRGWRVTLKLPQRCPKCFKVAVHFAGVCPECGEWTPWDLNKEKELYAHPRLFVDKGPAYFFPQCRKCGAPTNARGQKLKMPPLPKGEPQETDGAGSR